jgi:hypothetical protein
MFCEALLKNRSEVTLAITLWQYTSKHFIFYNNDIQNY